MRKLTPPQEAEPLVARALSYIAVNEPQSATSDLDDAVQVEPQNIAAWVARGLAYERLGQQDKAAGSYAKALNIKRDHEPARAGFTRVGGQFGKSYQTF
jgi:Tfp pilus assembly protein PilF